MRNSIDYQNERFDPHEVSYERWKEKLYEIVGSKKEEGEVGNMESEKVQSSGFKGLYTFPENENRRDAKNTDIS